MTSVEEHLKSIKTLLGEIQKKVKEDSIVETQKIIGFSCSEATCDIFALMLHKKNLITPGFNVNHRFFASSKIANGKFNFDFQNKLELLNLLIEQENFRTLLCYGREKERNVVEQCVKNVYKIKEIIELILGESI